MHTLFLAVALSYLVTGLLLSVVFVYLFRRTFTGHFWGAAVIGVVGSFAGGLIEFLFSDLIIRLSAINGIFNIFPPLISGTLLLTVFAYLSERKDEYGD